jgi:hypothetical protein
MNLVKKLNKIIGLLNNISLIDVLGVDRRSYNGRLTSR